MNRNADLEGRGRAPSNKNLATSDARIQLYTERTSTSWEITVPEALAFAKSTQSTFEEAEERLPEHEDAMVVQMSSDVEMGSDDEKDWQYETPGANAIAPIELFTDEDSKKDVLVEVIPSEFEEVRSKEAAVSSVSERSPNAFQPRALSELVAPAPEISFQCYICKEEFATNTKLDNHIRRVCFRRFESIRCSRKFTEMSDLSRHIQSHPKEKVFHCEYQSCGKRITKKFSLIQHTRIHTGEKPFHCEYPGCMKRFNQPWNLTQHKRLHTGERPFQCNFQNCEKRFSQNINLIRHQRIHAGETPFQCNYEGCGKRFRCESNRSRHERLHTGDKPYVCQQAGCREAFRWKRQLNVHLRGKHPK